MIAPLLNREEVCKILHISTKTFDRMARAGLLPLTKISPRVYGITEKALQQFIDDNTKTPTATNISKKPSRIFMQRNKKEETKKGGMDH